MVHKLDGFSHPSGPTFRLGSPIGLGYLSLVLSLRVDIKGKSYLEDGYLVPERGSGVKSIQSVSCIRTTFNFSRGGQ